VLTPAQVYNIGLEATIDVIGLRKRFGATLALDGMSFAVGPGQVTGFIGPNGAGKTTTMRIILGLEAPDEGRALIGGQPAPAEAAEVLTAAGAEVCASEPGVLLINGMSSERAVVLLTRHAIAFTEVIAHGATLEDACLELTGDAVEFRAVTR